MASKYEDFDVLCIYEKDIYSQAIFFRSALNLRPSSSLPCQVEGGRRK